MSVRYEHNGAAVENARRPAQRNNQRMVIFLSFLSRTIKLIKRITERAKRTMFRDGTEFVRFRYCRTPKVKEGYPSVNRQKLENTVLSVNATTRPAPYLIAAAWRRYPDSESGEAMDSLKKFSVE